MTAMLIEWVTTASFLILVVLLLRGLLGRHISAGLRYALWAMVLVRLLVPVQLFTSPVAGTNVFSDLYTEHTVADNIPAPVQSAAPAGDQLQGGVSVIQTGPALAVPGIVPDPPAAPNVPQAPAAPWPAAELLTVLGWVWLGGSAAMGLALLTSNVRFIRRLRRSRIPLDDVGCPLRVYAAVGLNSPCLFGLVRPAVYVTPETMASPAMLRHVLAHETTHCRHLDHVWNALRCAALAVHWWNPLVWLAVALSRRDGELACDEGALKRLGDGERRAYGHTLLALVTAKPRPADLLCCATTMAGDKKSLMERVSRIAKKPQRLVWAAVLAVLILTLACACAFGRAAEEPEEQGDQSNQSEHWGPSVDLADVPEEVRTAALDYGESMYEDFQRLLELREPHVDVEFDGWRIEAVEGPWTKNAQGTEVGVWRLDYTCHTPEPERAKVLLAGGMVLSEDGWMTPTDSITWLIFLKGEDGKWQYSHAMQGDASATDQPDSDFFWTRATNGIPSVTDPHFTGDVTGVPGDVLSQAWFYADGRYDYYKNFTTWAFSVDEDGNMPEPGFIEFDDWRIDYLKGPWRETVNGTELEVWRMNYELHTTQPERAEQAIVGGMYLTEDGWFCPTYPTCTYLVFTKGAEGGWWYHSALMVNSCGPEEGAAPEQFWQYVAEAVGAAAPGTGPEPEDPSQAPDPEMGGGLELLGESDLNYETGEAKLWLEDGTTPYLEWNGTTTKLDGQITPEQFFRLYVRDFDRDGQDEAVVSWYLNGFLQFDLYEWEVGRPVLMDSLDSQQLLLRFNRGNVAAYNKGTRELTVNYFHTEGSMDDEDYYRHMITGSTTLPEGFFDNGYQNIRDGYTYAYANEFHVFRLNSDTNSFICDFDFYLADETMADLPCVDTLLSTDYTTHYMAAMVGVTGFEVSYDGQGWKVQEMDELVMTMFE